MDRNTIPSETSVLGKGNTAEVLAYGNGKVCKLFFEGYPKEYIEHEYQNANAVYRLNLTVPEPFEIVSIGPRSGIVYERIDGEKLSDRLLKGTDIGDLLDLFISVHRKWLAKRSDNIVSYKEFLSTIIGGNEAGHQELMEEISALPDDNCVLHGDFHFENVLIKQGSGTPVVIDFMNVCCGPVLYDIARTFFLLCRMNPSAAKRYLEKMNVSETDIAPYVQVIRQCRDIEMQVGFKTEA